MDSPNKERKRALSFSGLSPVGNKLSIGLGSDIDHSVLPRIRHPSFALNADRPGVLDGLIDAASNKIRGSTEKDATSESHDQIPVEPLSVQIIAALDDAEFDTDPRKLSSATVVPSEIEYLQLQTETGSNSSFDTVGSLTSNSKRDSNMDSLSSTILKLYLSQLRSNDMKENGNQVVMNPSASTTSLIPEPRQDVYLPEYLRFHAPALASMTMPVNQITRAYSRFYGDSNQFARNIPTVTVNPLYERNAFTDANYSSDTDSRSTPPKYRGKTTCGHQSDHHMLEAASEARKLQMTGRRLELDFHRSTVSLSSTPGRSRPLSGNSTPVTKRRMSISARNSKFDLTQVYGGLLPPNKPISPSSSEWSVSNASLEATLVNRLAPSGAKSGCVTPPGSLISVEPFDPLRSAPNDHSNSGTLERLRSMFTNFKHNIEDSETNKYFYMDEQTLERRAQAQASNVIAPVSF